MTLVLHVAVLRSIFHDSLRRGRLQHEYSASSVYNLEHRGLHVRRNTLDPGIGKEVSDGRREERADVRLPAFNVNADGTWQHQRKLDILLQNLACVLRIADFNELQRLPS